MPTFITDTFDPFKAYLVGRGYAAQTLTRHMYVVSGKRQGFIVTAQKIKGPRPTTGQIDHECIDRYMASHTGALGSRSNKIESLRLYLRWAENRGLLRSGFTAEKLLEGYKSRRAERQPKYYIPVEDFPALLAVAHSERDRAVLAVALYTLARQGEIGMLTLKSLDFNRKIIRIYREKRKRWTETGMAPELQAEMTQWLKVYASMQGYEDYRDMVREHPEWLLVPSRRTWHGGGYRLQPETQITAMENIVKMALTDLGVTSTEDGLNRKHKGEGMHTIRRSGARALFGRLVEKVGYEGALTFVQALLDHETSEMTLRYIGMDWVKEQLNNWLLTNSMYG